MADDDHAITQDRQQFLYHKFPLLIARRSFVGHVRIMDLAILTQRLAKTLEMGVAALNPSYVSNAAASQLLGER